MPGSILGYYQLSLFEGTLHTLHRYMILGHHARWGAERLNASKKQYLTEQYFQEWLRARGQQQTSIDKSFSLETKAIKIARFQAEPEAIKTEVGKDTTLVSALIAVSVQYVDGMGLCREEQFEMPVSDLVTTCGSEAGMSAVVCCRVEKCLVKLVRATTVKLLIVLEWGILVTQKELVEWIHGCEQRCFFETSGLLPLGLVDHWTEWLNVSTVSVVSVMVFNEGPGTATVALEGSPDGDHVVYSGIQRLVAPGGSELLVPKYFTKFLRLKGFADSPTGILYWIQAQT